MIDKLLRMTSRCAALTALLFLVCVAAHAATTEDKLQGWPQDRTVKLPSGAVFYRDTGGAGTPIVFLHAGSGNSMLWEHQIPAVSNAGYRFIAIDYRGTGETATASASAGPPVTRVEELVGALGLSRFHLVGTAAGGGVALEYALANPDTLLSVVVANSIGNVRDDAYQALGRRLRPKEFEDLPLELRELGPSYRAANADGVARWLELSGTNSRPPPRSGGAAAPTSTGDQDDPHTVTWERLQALAVPTLLMTGDADLYTPPSVLRMFSSHIPGAETVIVPESGHSAYWENPEFFNRAVLDFIKRH